MKDFFAGVGLLTTILAAAGWIYAFYWRGDAKKATEKLNAKTEQLLDVRSKLSDKNARLEAVITDLKHELTQLGEDLDACVADPGAVRDRVRFMLSRAARARNAAGGVSGGAPAGAAGDGGGGAR